MTTRKAIAAFAAALVLWAWSSNEGLGQPRPPGPPMGGGGFRPVMGPVGGPPRGLNVPGGIGGPGFPCRIGAQSARPPSPIGGAGRPLGTFSGPVRPGGFGPSGISRPGLGSSTIGGPARPQAIGPGGLAGRDHVPGLGGLGSLAKSSGVARNPSTFPVDRQALSEQGNHIRNRYRDHDYFGGDWWGRHRGAWRAGRWADAAAGNYGTGNWTGYYGYCGYVTEPVYYDYGSYVVYESTNVYVNGEAVATQQQYAQQAMTIADMGKQARVTDDEEWLPLGVFAMIQGEQANGNDLFQLAVNKSGVIRGNYYNSLTDITLPVRGSVDEKTQRAAWTVGDRKEPIFEAGFANLTRPETTMLVHFGKERTQQLTLVRIDKSVQPP